MENKLMIFENEAFGKVRTLNLNGEPWFVAADVCRELKLGNSIDVNWVLLFSSRPIYFSFFYFVDFITGF